MTQMSASELRSFLAGWADAERDESNAPSSSSQSGASGLRRNVYENDSDEDSDEGQRYDVQDEYEKP